MSKPPEYIKEGEKAKSVVAKFEVSRAWNLPVITENGTYVGFISKSRLLTAYREKLQNLSSE